MHPQDSKGSIPENQHTQHSPGKYICCGGRRTQRRAETRAFDPATVPAHMSVQQPKRELSRQSLHVDEATMIVICLALSICSVPLLPLCAGGARSHKHRARLPSQLDLPGLHVGSHCRHGDATADVPHCLRLIANRHRCGGRGKVEPSDDDIRVGAAGADVLGGPLPRAVDRGGQRLRVAEATEADGQGLCRDDSLAKRRDEVPQLLLRRTLEGRRSAWDMQPRKQLTASTDGPRSSQDYDLPCGTARALQSRDLAQTQ
mmetsp:Transcript_67007/g.173502  ORF Transcript_67007/g.173502 Transcript_67007/m.173502 type:complete len:259 (+) Transcript_67007:147-923(+)